LHFAVQYFCEILVGNLLGHRIIRWVEISEVFRLGFYLFI